MLLYYTERNNPVNLQYERLLHLREIIMYTAYDFTCMLLSVTLKDVESTVQHIEAKGNPVNFNGIFLLKIF